MKTIEDIRLEGKVSDLILEFVQNIGPALDDITTSDLQGTCGALAMNIIKIVKEQ